MIRFSIYIVRPLLFLITALTHFIIVSIKLWQYRYSLDISFTQTSFIASNPDCFQATRGDRCRFYSQFFFCNFRAVARGIIHSFIIYCSLDMQMRHTSYKHMQSCKKKFNVTMQKAQHISSHHKQSIERCKGCTGINQWSSSLRPLVFILVAKP